MHPFQSCVGVFLFGFSEHGSRGVEVFVGGLARSLNEDKVRKVFAACGEITDMRLIKDQNGILKVFHFDIIIIISHYSLSVSLF